MRSNPYHGSSLSMNVAGTTKIFCAKSGAFSATAIDVLKRVSTPSLIDDLFHCISTICSV